MKSLVVLASISVLFFSVDNLLAEEPRPEESKKVDVKLLVLVDAQESESEATGRVWVIYESGEFKVLSFAVENITLLSEDTDFITLKKGKLNKEQLDDLVAYMQYRGLKDIPEFLGKVDMEDNRHGLLLFADGEFVSLVLDAGQTLENAELEYAKSDSKDAVYVDRFASIVKTIKSLCGE